MKVNPFIEFQQGMKQATSKSITNACEPTKLSEKNQQKRFSSFNDSPFTMKDFLLGKLVFFCCILVGIFLFYSFFLQSSIEVNSVQGHLPSEKHLLQEFNPDEPCEEWDIIKKVVFVDYDLQGMSEEQIEAFTRRKAKCSYWFITKNHLIHYIELWNQLEKQPEGEHVYLKFRDQYTVAEQRILLILLHLYMHQTTYVHLSIPLKNVQSRCLKSIYSGRDVIFSKVGYEIKEKDIIVPSPDIDYLKIPYKNNWMLKRMINTLSVGGNWLEICQTYQCTIMECMKN